MIKKIIGGAVLALALPFVASAATISNPLFSNGDTTIDAAGGATVSGTFTLTVGPGEVCEVLRTQSDVSQPFVDTSVGGQLGYQEQVYIGVPFSVKLPPNTGTYYPTVQCAGAFGGNRAINGGDTVAPSFISLPSTSLGTVRVVANGPTYTGVGNTPIVFGSADWTKSFIEALVAALKPVTAPAPAPAVNTACTNFYAKLAGAQYGVTNTQNGILQGFLIGEGMSIPLLQNNQAPFGFWGTQTQSAMVAYKAIKGCI